MKPILLLLSILFFTINLSGQSDPELVFNIANKSYGDPEFDLSAVSNKDSQGPITYSIVSGEDIVSLDGETVKIKNAGTAKLKATIAEWSDFSAASKEASLTVNRKGIQIKANDIDEEYGYAFSTGGGYTIQDDLAYDDQENIFQGKLSVYCSQVQEGEVADAGGYTLKLSYQNYTGNYLIYPVDGVLTVRRKLITYKIEDATRRYGESNPVFNGYFPEGGFVNGDTENDLSPAPEITCNASHSSNVNIEDDQYAIFLAKDHPDNWNYELNVNRGYLTITPALLRLETLPAVSILMRGDTAYKRPYGHINPIFEVNWKIQGDLHPFVDSSELFGGAAYIDIGGVDERTDCGQYPLKLKGLSLTNNNYTLEIFPCFLVIEKDYITLVPNDQAIPYGDIEIAKDTFSFDKSVFHFREKDLADFSGDLSLYTDATSSSPADSSFVIEFKGGITHKNYFIYPEKGELTIEKAQLEIHVNPQSKYYKDPMPDLNGGVVVKGYKNGESHSIFVKMGGIRGEGDTITGSNIRLSVNTSEVNQQTIPGKYTLSMEQNLIADNYDFLYYDGIFEVKPAPFSINIHNLNKLVGSVNPPLVHHVNADLLHHTPDLASFGFDINAYSVACDSTSPADSYEINYQNLPSELHYNITVNKGWLFVHDSARIEIEPVLTGVCRDASESLSLFTPSVNPSYQWYVELSPGTGYIPVDYELADSLNFSLIRTESLRLDSVLTHYANYKFNCLVTSSFKVDSLNPESEIIKSYTTSQEAGIWIKDTPPFADVIVKGGSILICMDPNVDGYRWGKEDDIITSAVKSYLDISSNPSDSLKYWVETRNDRTGCTAKSSLKTQNGFVGQVPFRPEAFEMSLHPNPAVVSGGITLKITNPVPYMEYTLNIYNQRGEKIYHKDGKSDHAEVSEIYLFDDSFQAGIYFAEFFQLMERDVKMFIVNAK